MYTKADDYDANTLSSAYYKVSLKDLINKHEAISLITKPICSDTK